MEQSKFYQIKNITEHEYTLVGCDGSVITRSIQDADKSASAFTIQDAQDGDVLAWDDSNCIAIFSKIKNDESFISHGFIGNITGVFEEGYGGHGITNHLHPATKKQRDLLFQKIHEAGYEWNAEKKELKKIEHKPFWSERKPYVISTNRELLSLQHEAIGWLEDHKQFAAKDDIQYIQDCIEKIRAIQLPQWSEEDEYIFNKILNWIVIVNPTSSIFEKLPKEQFIERLKFLKDRVQPQSKQDWSKEDEKMFKSLKTLLNNASCYSCTEGVDKILDWLKSLKDRYTWKPSDEQMEALLIETEGWDEDSVNGQNLTSLYNDLKTLKENSYE